MVVDHVQSNEGVLVQDAPDCLLCGRRGVLLYKGLRDRLFDAPGVWSLMMCRACGLCWLTPRPLPPEVGKLYANYYTHHSSGQRGGLRAFIKNSILASAYGYPVAAKNALLGWMFARVGPIQERAGGDVLWLQALHRGKLLDVGCGNGQFLARMRNLGWEVMGVEPDPVAARIAQDSFDLRVFCGTLEQAPIPEESVDVVTLNHVLEHVSDPIATLIACRRVIGRAGKVVVVTPNNSSLGKRMWGQCWRGWEIPRHFFLFSPRSLSACAQRAGLAVQELRTVARSAPWIWEASGLLRKRGTFPGGVLLPGGRLRRFEGLIFWLAEYWLSRWWEVGEELVLVAAR